MKNRAANPAIHLFFAVFAAFVLTVTPTALSAAEKHASLIIDANSGKVLHADNASRQRYPASLTKLMTLYMTFDALRTGRLKLSTVLRASKKAAKMPSTNLHMKPGDRITVRDAIKALVVRSANDVAVVLAEQLGGSEYKFAKLMTATARRLGMSNTTFKNASGLPNRQQTTTARDMAVLALALRRHYPEYYHFFRTTEFKYKGKKYTSHNWAMNRIAGADGLKTGYIRASGFNLVTSATRRGRSVIGVVMGGKTAKERDNQMVRLVERTFSRMNLQENRRQFVLHDDPIPVPKPQELLALAKQEGAGQQLAAAPVPMQQPEVASTAPKQYASFEPHAEDKKQYIAFDFGSRKKSKPFTPPPAGVKESPYDKELKDYRHTRGQFMPVAYQPAGGDNHYQVKPNHNWGVQVGAYEESREALVAASNAASKAPKLLQNARIHVTDKYEVKGKVLYRARLADMTKTQAKQACSTLEAMKTPCFVYREQNSNI